MDELVWIDFRQLSRSDHCRELWSDIIVETWKTLFIVPWLLLLSRTCTLHCDFPRWWLSCDVVPQCCCTSGAMCCCAWCRSVVPEHNLLKEAHAFDMRQCQLHAMNSKELANEATQFKTLDLGMLMIHWLVNHTLLFGCFFVLEVWSGWVANSDCMLCSKHTHFGHSI